MRRRNKIVVVAAVLAICFLIGIREYNRSGTSRPELASGAPSGPCTDFRQAKSHAGENGCISGFIFKAYTSRSGNTFLDFCADYRDCPFSSVVFASDRKKFGNLGSLAGREVQIHGLITTYQGRAEIVVHDPWQLSVSQ